MCDLTLIQWVAFYFLNILFGGLIAAVLHTTATSRKPRSVLS